MSVKKVYASTPGHAETWSVDTCVTASLDGRDIIVTPVSTQKQRNKDTKRSGNKQGGEKRWLFCGRLWNINGLSREEIGSPLSVNNYRILLKNIRDVEHLLLWCTAEESYLKFGFDLIISIIPICFVSLCLQQFCLIKIWLLYDILIWCVWFPGNSSCQGLCLNGGRCEVRVRKWFCLQGTCSFKSFINRSLVLLFFFFFFISEIKKFNPLGYCFGIIVLAHLTFIFLRKQCIPSWFKSMNLITHKNKIHPCKCFICIIVFCRTKCLGQNAYVHLVSRVNFAKMV